MSLVSVFSKGSQWCFRVRLQPGAKRDHLVGLLEDQIKVQVAAPPLEGKANAQLIKFLAKQLGIPKSRLEIVSGLRSRDKTVAVSGASESGLSMRLTKLLKSL